MNQPSLTMRTHRTFYSPIFVKDDTLQVNGSARSQCPLLGFMEEAQGTSWRIVALRVQITSSSRSQKNLRPLRICGREMP